MHWVSSDIMVQPKPHGGMGLEICASLIKHCWLDRLGD
jgi:hypothetical protein